MKIFISQSYDPYINIATEETLLKDSSIIEDIVFIWQNKNTIFFGRNQNIHEEINSEFVKENNIKLVRRLSGGGAVYHDLGNVNFTFITKNENNSYQKFLEPVIEFLKSIGLNAIFKGKNDLEIDGFKVSGNAQYIYRDRMFHHGTLLFDTDLAKLSNALKPNKLKLESKGIKSAIARVSNIKPLLKKEMDSEEFKNLLVDFFVKQGAKLESLDNYKYESIKALSIYKASDEWNYTKNPDFNVFNEKRYSGGTLQVYLNVIHNKINEIVINGDFLSKNEFDNIYKYFKGVIYNDDTIKNIVDSIEDFENYFGTISKQDLVEILLGK